MHKTKQVISLVATFSNRPSNSIKLSEKALAMQGVYDKRLWENKTEYFANPVYDIFPVNIILFSYTVLFKSCLPLSYLLSSYINSNEIFEQKLRDASISTTNCLWYKLIDDGTRSISLKALNGASSDTSFERY